MSWLDDINEAVTDAFLDPESCFRDAQILRTIETPGGAYSTGTVSTVTQDCRCFVNEYTAFMRGHLGVPDNVVNVLILQKNDAGNWVTVQVGDTVRARGQDWRILRVSQDPARATWDCDGQPNG